MKKEEFDVVGKPKTVRPNIEYKDYLLITEIRKVHSVLKDIFDFARIVLAVGACAVRSTNGYLFFIGLGVLGLDVLLAVLVIICFVRM